MSSLILEALKWIADQAESLWLLIPVTTILVIAGRFASTYSMEVLRERRARIAEEGKAASEFVAIAEEFKRYWVQRYFADQNWLPDPEPESMVEWAGDPFEPLITPEHQSLYSRLSRRLRNQAYDLNHLVREAKENIASLSEHDEMQIDTEGPIHVCEIAIAADAFWVAVLQATGVRKPKAYDAISDIESTLHKHRNEKRDAEKKRQRFNEEFFATRSVKTEGKTE